MGLFDKILGGGESGPYSKQEAITGVLLAVVAADGEISPEEVNGLIGAVARMKLFRGLSQEQFTSQIRKLQKDLQKQGADAVLVKVAAALPAELKEMAFALAADLVFADGTVEAEEKALLEKIQKAMGVTDSLALKVVEVMQIKNRG